MQGKYKVITLCGSTKFKDAFLETQKRLTLAGNIVISVGLFGHSGDNEVWEGKDEDTITLTKLMLDDMHRRKIDMADEIFVINVGGYIGESTRAEITYAREQHKVVKYLEEVSEDKFVGIPSKDIPVRELPISINLKNVLRRENIHYLGQLKDYPEESIRGFRNLGKVMFEELKSICDQYNVHLHNRIEIEDDSIPVYFYQSQYEKIFKAGIRTKADVMKIDEKVLAKMFKTDKAIYNKLMLLKMHEITHKNSQ